MTYTVRTIPEIEDDVTDVKHELTNIMADTFQIDCLHEDDIDLIQEAMVRAFEFGRYGSYE
tara:strand:- start:2048 stop:2230 length:183 start_codon:yes stop_codon:yes gene_type:complete